MGQTGDRSRLANSLGPRRAVLRLRARHWQDDLHHQRGGSVAPLFAQRSSKRAAPNDDAALKLLYLAIKNASLRRRRAIKWAAAMSEFAIQLGERFPGTTR